MEKTTNKPYQSKSVHDAHCCSKHGCVYCEDDCPVVNGTEGGISCELCESDEFYYPQDLMRITGLTPEDFEALKKDAEAYRKLKLKS